MEDEGQMRKGKKWVRKGVRNVHLNVVFFCFVFFNPTATGV